MLRCVFWKISKLWTIPLFLWSLFIRAAFYFSFFCVVQMEKQRANCFLFGQLLRSESRVRVWNSTETLSLHWCCNDLLECSFWFPCWLLILECLGFVSETYPQKKNEYFLSFGIKKHLMLLQYILWFHQTLICTSTTCCFF